MIERLPHHDVHPQRLVAGHGVRRPHPEQRQVDEHVRPVAQLRQPPHALHRELDLPHASSQRHVQRPEGSSADDPVRLEAVALLKALDRCHDRTGIDVRWRPRIAGRSPSARRRAERTAIEAHDFPGSSFGARFGRSGTGSGSPAAASRRYARASVGRGNSAQFVARGSREQRRGFCSARRRGSPRRRRILGRDRVAPVHGRGIDASQVHRLHHARDGHADAEVEVRASSSRHPSGLHRGPSLARTRRRNPSDRDRNPQPGKVRDGRSQVSDRHRASEPENRSGSTS